MRTVHTGPLGGLLGQLAVLAVLAATVGLSGAGWAAGFACGLVTWLGLARGLAHAGRRGLSPADKVTLTRATLVGGVAALVVDSLTGDVPATSPVPGLVALCVVALVLDAVDGRVARRTGTVSPLGAAFDMEVDAFLILVLSGYVAASVGPWVLAIGFARYALFVAGWLLPWLRQTVPPRYWRKVVAATQGIVLTAAAADVLPAALVVCALAAALALLTESFGRDVCWLWGHRRTAPELYVVPVRRPERVAHG